MNNWIHTTHCALTKGPTKRTLNEVQTDLRTSLTDNDHNSGNETLPDTGQTSTDEILQKDSTMEDLYQDSPTYIDAIGVSEVNLMSLN